MCASDCRPARLWRARLGGLGRLGVLPAALVLASFVALAQNADREQEQLRRLKLQMRQLQQEQSTLRDAQARATQDRAAAEAALARAQGELTSQQRGAAAAARRASALAAEVARLQKDKADLQAQLQRLGEQLAQGRSLQAEQQAGAARAMADWEGRHQQAAGLLAQCRAHNLELHALGMELLDRYEHKGIGEVLAASEPFVQTARVRLENAKAGYQGRLDAARITP